ncbi:membrane fusion protein (multidrug efflux system) [Rhodoligotrophos appendicifer]|uniref:efflux RND transporter periplasmic adaptor subunit n=1 Tax=Rhodoligotrophos appendicifer TaxID=987056 RepID=UPI0014795CBC
MTRLEQRRFPASRAALVLACVAAMSCMATAVSAQTPGQIVPVDAARVEMRQVTEALSAVGELTANESVVIRPEIDGRIAEIHFEEGQRVGVGSLLFTLDDALYRAQVAEAEANLALSRQNDDRAEQLFKSRAGTERSRDESLAQLRIAEARLQIAQKNLGDTRILAPFDGILGLRSVSVGAYVTKGIDLVDLIQTDPLKVSFQLPERFLAHLSVGQGVEVTVDALPGEKFGGRVTVISPSITIAGRSLSLRAEISNPQDRLKPGLFARVNLTVAQREQAMLIPETALMPRGSEQFVYRVVDGKAQETAIRIGVRRAGAVEVVGGLNREDVVITGGQQKLRNGSAVKVVGGSAASPPVTTGGTQGTTGSPTAAAKS